MHGATESSVPLCWRTSPSNICIAHQVDVESDDSAGSSVGGSLDSGAWYSPPVRGLAATPIREVQSPDAYSNAAPAAATTTMNETTRIISAWDPTRKAPWRLAA